MTVHANTAIVEWSANPERRTMRLCVSARLVVIGYCGAPTFADPAYTAEEIIKKFTPAILASTRGICIGTEAECGGTRKPHPGAGAEPACHVRSEFGDPYRVGEGEPRSVRHCAEGPAASPLLHFSIDGHTDARGSDPYKSSLSERRAQAVAEYLAQQGRRRLEVRREGLRQVAAVDRRIRSTPRTAGSRRIFAQ